MGVKEGLGGEGSRAYRAAEAFGVGEGGVYDGMGGWVVMGWDLLVGRGVLARYCGALYFTLSGGLVCSVLRVG